MRKYDVPFLEQLNRILRLRKSLDKFSFATNDNFETAVDAFTSFFIQCYHLSDWLFQSGFNKNSVYQFIDNNKWLSLCKDMANNQKHQKITHYKPKNSFVGNPFGITTPISRYYVGNNKSEFGINVWEFGMPVNVQHVADKCIESWYQFIETKKITDRK